MANANKPEKNVNNKRHFWKDFKAELKKVIWPTRSQVINNTIVVLVIVLIVAALCFVLDLAFEALNTYGIDNLKTIVQNSVQTQESNVVDGENNNVTDANNIEDANNITDDTTDNTENNTSDDAVSNEVAE